MKLFTWVKSFAIVRISSILFLSILNFFSSNVVAQGDIAFITVTSTNDFKIKSYATNEQVGTFTVEIPNHPRISIDDGSLLFEVKIIPTIDEVLKYNDIEIINDPEKGRVFTLSINQNELSNQPFDVDFTLTSNNLDLIFDKVKLHIEPKVEIIPDTRNVDFGKIIRQDTHIQSTNSPEVRFSCSILKNAICEVSSENNFRLKHKEKDEYIEYSIETDLIKADALDLVPGKVNYHLDPRRNMFFVRFFVDTHVNVLPSSGECTDTFKVLLKCNK
ncbi:MAG: hypothetical protein IJA14_02605 [Alphaproteobacteria bacterium]|nr:hypothetical protein [Alphaproteobacteria bacterium]